MKSGFAALAVFALFTGGFGALQAEARTWRIEEGQSAALAQAFAQAGGEDTIRIDRGTYMLAAGVTLNAARATVRGAGVDQTILSFQSAAPGAGLQINAPRVRLEGFTIQDAQGDAVSARNCDGLQVSGVRARWQSAAPAGASGVHVSACANVLIERSSAERAAFAGLYLEGVRNAIVSQNSARGAYIGLALANVTNVDATENQLGSNAIGAAVFDTPAIAQGGGVRLFRNTIADNNAQSPAPADATFAAMPTSLGVLIMGARNVHVLDNDITNHGSTHVLIMAYPGSSGGNASFIPIARDVMIRNNRFGAAGNAPQGALANLGGVLPDVIWDGADTYFGAGAPRTAIPRVVMRDNRSTRGGIGSFLSLGLSAAGTPFNEAAPNPAFPPLINLAEPERVRLD